MEALFYHKKLITNCKSIVNYEFYRKGNVFILGEDSMDELFNFINTPYIDVDDEIIEQYNEKGWVQRFYKVTY